MYTSALGEETLVLLLTLPGKAMVSIHRLWFGYPGISAMLNQERDAYSHSCAISATSLLYYLLDCPTTAILRQIPDQQLPLHDFCAATTALVMLALLQLHVNRVLLYRSPSDRYSTVTCFLEPMSTPLIREKYHHRLEDLHQESNHGMIMTEITNVNRRGY